MLLFLCAKPYRMKLPNILLIISVCFLFIGQALQAQTTKKLHQSFMLDGIKDITIDVSYPALDLIN